MNRGIVIQVTNFCADRPHLTAEVEVWPDGSTRFVDRTGWTHNADYDELATTAAVQLSREQRTAAE